MTALADSFPLAATATGRPDDGPRAHWCALHAVETSSPRCDCTGPGEAPTEASTDSAADPENMLDRLPGLWNTAAHNPDVQARQKRSEERTAFMVANDPGYARDLAAGLDWISTYEVELNPL